MNEGEYLIKRRNGNYSYFGSTKSFREISFYIKEHLIKYIEEVKWITERRATIS